MAKISGKDLEFWFDGKEYPVISVNLSEEFDQLEATDTSTAGDGKDFELGRANREISVDMFLYTPDGAEINSGTLIAGKKYRVTAKQTVLSAYDVGQIFVANGTEVMSANDKVVPLGDRVTGKDMSFNFNSVNVPVTDVDMNISYDTLDSTDTSTTGDGSEVGVSRAERESKVTVIAKSDDQDLLTTNPQPQSATLTFKSGQTVVGQAIPVSKNVVDETTGLAKIDYSFKWKGAPTETALGLPTATEKSFKIILKRGASTHKQYTGNAVITNKSITANVKELTKVSLSIYINGSVTYAVAN